MEMFLYRALQESTKLYKVGVIIAENKEKATEIALKEFDQEHYTIAIFSKESICDLYVVNEKCVDINDLCWTYGFRTEKEIRLQNKLNGIQPLIDQLSVLGGM